MDIQHHLEDNILMAYAAGSLPEAFNLIVAAHVSLCDTCRATLYSLESVGGTLLESTAFAAMAPDSLEQAMQRLGTKTEISRAPASAGTLPRPVQDYVGGDLAAVRWRPIGMGVKQAILPTSSAASARLLHIPAGVAMPDHSHGGTELTLVLQGAFLDGDECFARGDIETTDQTVTHTPTADIHQDCICLAVTDAPLRFKGWLPRIVQRFARI